MSISYILLLLLIGILSLNFFTVEEKIQTTSTNGIVTNIWIESSKLNNLRENNLKYLFVDIGHISLQGKIETPEEEIIKFIESVDKFEKVNNYQFTVLPYTEIILDKYSFSEDFQTNLIKEHNHLINLGFDGVFIDIEKIPFNERSNFLSFINDLEKSIPKNSKLAIYAGHLNNENKNEWEWDANLYAKLSNKADLIIMPAYDTSFKHESSYQSYIDSQLKKLDNIKSTKAKFLLGIPTHKPDPETIENSLAIYNNYKNPNTNIIGVSIFAEWTMDDKEWAIFQNSL